MPDKQPHFEIPGDRVRSSPIRVQGRAKPFGRPNYSAHADFLRERAAVLEDYIAHTADVETERLFVQVRTPQELPIKGERQRLRSAGLDVVALSPVDPNSATAQLRKAELNDFRSKVREYGSSPDNRGKSYLSVIEDLGPVPTELKLAQELLADTDDAQQCLLVFYSSLSEGERATVLLAVRSFMARNQLEIGGERRLSNGVTLVEATLRPTEARQIGSAFSTLRQVVPNHVFFVPDGRRISAISPHITVNPPAGRTGVAVVDTGISSACLGVEGAVHARIPHLPTGAVAGELGHGTFVASRILYGDGLEAELRSGILQPQCPLVDVPVMGVDAAGRMVAVHEGHLASAVDAAMPSLPPTTRVVNVSLGTNEPTVDGNISIVAQVLDQIARDRDVVVVTTAGNIRDPRVFQQYPRCHIDSKARIDSPGDSLLALTVGSFARFTDHGALSQAGHLSAFSRRGPGPFGGMKPELVAHGGNCMADGTTSSRVGVHGLASAGNAWECDYGTSFAAPLVASMAASLFDHYDRASANLVRALLVHFTTPIPAPSIGLPSEHLVGLGEPQLDAARWSSDHAAAFLFQGELTAASHTFVPFHVPSCLSAGGGGRLQIKATVVIDPPVSPDNQVEYSNARVSLGLRKPTDVGHRPVGVSTDIVEVDKWSPLTQLTKVFYRFYQPGEWELQVRLWTRGQPPGFRQRFAAVVEVVDTLGTQPVREGVEREAGSVFRVAAISAAAA